MRIEPDPVHLSVPGEAIAVQQVLDFYRSVVRQSEFPERHLEVRFVRVVGIKIDVEEQIVLRLPVALSVIEDVVVPSVVEAQGLEAPQCRLLPAQGVDELDVVPDVTRSVHVPDADLILLGIEIFLLSGNGRRLADLEAVVDAIVAGERRRQHEAGSETRPAAMLEEVRIDVRRVGEEVWPHHVGAVALRQLHEVFFKFHLEVAPGEIGIGLGEADLREPLHHLRPCEGLGQENGVGML